MRFFYQLSAIVIVTLLAVLGWDLSGRRVSHGDKELIIYAGMFGPGEPVQLLYSGPPAGLEPEHPFGAQAAGHYARTGGGPGRRWRGRSNRDISRSFRLSCLIQIRRRATLMR